MDNYPNTYQNRTPQNWNGGQNSYLGNFQNNQQFMVQQTTIPGRLVNSLDDVVPGEVPMNGNPTYFPTADGELIHVLRWTREGKIDPTTYIRQKPEAQTTMTSAAANSEAFQMIMTRLDEMQKEIKRLSRPRKRNHYQNNQPVKEENDV